MTCWFVDAAGAGRRRAARRAGGGAPPGARALLQAYPWWGSAATAAEQAARGRSLRGVMPSPPEAVTRRRLPRTKPSAGPKAVCCFCAAGFREPNPLPDLKPYAALAPQASADQTHAGASTGRCQLVCDGTGAERRRRAARRAGGGAPSGARARHQAPSRWRGGDSRRAGGAWTQVACRVRIVHAARGSDLHAVAR